MTFAEFALLVLVAVLLILLWRSRRAAPHPDSVATVPSKLDPRLQYLLQLPLAELRRLKREDDDVYRQAVRAIASMREEADKADGDALEKLRVEIARREAALVVPTTFGVYFPADDPKDVARVTHLKVPFISGTISAEASAKDLAALGIHVRSQSGNIFTSYVPLDTARRLQSLRAIHYVELARPWRPQLDTSIPQTGIDIVHAGPPAITGLNVIVGLVETGSLDFYHPAFRNNDGIGEGNQGSSRVLYLWDQTLLPDPANGESDPWGGSYGTEYNKADIDNDLQGFPPAYSTVRRPNPLDSFHGHLVASCAVGNKRMPGYRYTGAAPGADIIYVQTQNGDNYVFADSTNILDGVNYIFEKASDAGKACVVNLSASDSLSAHDGSSLGEQFLDRLLDEPGRAIVCSAGNYNGFGLHTRNVVSQNATTSVNLTYRLFPPARYDDTVQFWYDHHDRFKIRLTIPTSPSTVIGPLDAGLSSSVSLAGGINVSIDSIVNHPRNGDNLIEVRITGVSAATPIPAGNWAFELTGVVVLNGIFQAWVDRNNQAAVTWNPAVEDETTLGAPATARRPISVGAHNAAAPPVIVGLSGRGPTRDGRVKPEIAAPGSQMKAAWRRDMNAAIPESLEYPPPEFPSLQPVTGTSYSAPIVAGAAALLFECLGKGLTCGDIKQILEDMAGVPTIGVPSNAFGFGFLQMQTACAAPPPNVDVWLRDSIADVGIEPYTGAVAWLSPDIQILDAAGNVAANPTHDPLNIWNNLVDVTVRNRGSHPARNIEVFLYWADPATNIPFPGEWRSSGFYTGQPNFLMPGNRLVIQQLNAASNTTVRFAWAPPAPGSNIRGDDHFCLIARLEHEADPSNVNVGGWPIIHGSNNVALHNVEVMALSPLISAGLFVNGTDDPDRLEIMPEQLSGQIEILLPTRALPWHELVTLERTQGPRPRYGEAAGIDPAEQVQRVIESEDVERILGIRGASRAAVDGEITQVLAAPNAGRLVFSEVRIVSGAKMPLRVLVTGPQLEGDVGWIHVAQRSAGKIVGGVSIEARAQLPEMTKYDVRRVRDQVEVTVRRA